MADSCCPSRSRLDSVLDDIEEYLQDREDVRDGSDGQQLPNREMSLLTDLRYARSYAPSEIREPDVRGLLGNCLDHWERVPNDIKSDPGMDNLNNAMRQANTALGGTSK